MTTTSGLAADSLVGCVLEGRYRITARIARGGTSTVYAATDDRLDRRVAVKVMDDAFACDPVFLDRIAREARAAARLTHLNVVQVFDQGQDGGHVFLVMELVAGRTLRDLLRERGRLSPAQAVSIMEPVLGALAAAHRAGLVHRDVKPENILLSDEGLVKVADFGLARAIEQGTNAQTGAMMGTVAYCSPEQITRRRTDARSDVYSAGIVLFELLTGRPPYVAESPVEVAYQHVHGSVPPPSRLAPGSPAPLDALVLRATAGRPEHRPADAAALLAELADVRFELRLPVIRVPVRTRDPRGDAAATATTDAGPGRTGHLTGQQDTALVPPGPTQAVPSYPALRHDTIVDRPQPPRPGAAPPPNPATGRARAGATGPAPRRRRRTRRALIVLLVLLLLGAGAGVGGWWLASGRWASVPAVTNEDPVSARAALTDSGLQVAPDPQTEFSESVPKDRVTRTDPSSGSRARRGQVVHLFLSRGPERFAVIDVHGESLAAATAALSAIPVTLVNRTAYDDSAPKGSVMSTDPPAGTPVKRGATVTITVSNGPPVIAVPGVTGQAQQDASAALKNAGFAVTVQRDFSDDVPAGHVISQQPAAAQTAVKFSSVTIVVSQGPPYVSLPGVHGKSAAEARALLEAAGMHITVNKVFGGLLDITVGVDVDQQDQNAAGQVRRGSTVVIDVA